jgi:hypothetical protein
VRNVGEIYQREFRHALLKLAEARVHELLALLGHVILSVFAEVAKRSSLLDLLRQLMLEFMLHLPDFFF